MTKIKMTEKKCRKCDNMSITRNLCRKHYTQWLRKKTSCKKCSKKKVNMGLCEEHLAELKKKAEPQKCSMCYRPAKAKGFCLSHYAQNYYRTVVKPSKMTKRAMRGKKKRIIGAK
jgi:hypothetical protein